MLMTTSTKESLKIDSKAKFITDTLIKNGYTAYAVGGCIRDLMVEKYLKRKANTNDTDICTQATPLEVKRIFKKQLGLTVLDTGLQHGTVSIVIKDHKTKKHTVYEVTTYRIEQEYTDNRRPDSVKFTDDIGEDLKRRDFTINAMAYSNGNLVSIQSSIADIKNKQIRCVGNPYERFKEDPLRILRAFRFQAILGFSIERYTKKAMQDTYTSLNSIQRERIRAELIKAFSGVYIARALKDNSSLVDYILGESGSIQIRKHKIDQIAQYTKQGKNNRNLDPLVSIGIYLIDRKETVNNLLRQLRFQIEEVKSITELVTYSEADLSNRVNIKKLLSILGEEQFRRLILVKKSIANKSDIQKVLQIEAQLNSIIRNKEAVSIKDLKITGQDIMKLGISPGPQIGFILSSLLDGVLEDRIKNTKTALETEVKHYINRGLSYGSQG